MRNWLPSANRLHLLQCYVTRLGHRELPVWLPARKTGGNWLRSANRIHCDSRKQSVAPWLLTTNSGLILRNISFRQTTYPHQFELHGESVFVERGDVSEFLQNFPLSPGFQDDGDVTVDGDCWNAQERKGF
ncbi:hypothetical protein AVEN_205586-1 [Araneus ventricosus]|uniref:Uncharacterized protein n=1 Tax=Araneus ventricosus TaxID=182803 RepID=A0A4Y2FA73_ARAVE|nr:hypothetical protein AVEN_205586-1 [Araneus ventricosus]